MSGEAPPVPEEALSSPTAAGLSPAIILGHEVAEPDDVVVVAHKPEDEDAAAEEALSSPAAAGLSPAIIVEHEVAEPDDVVVVARKPEDADAEEEKDNWGTWEVPLWASVESSYGGIVSTENILTWTKPQFKGLTIFFSPVYRPSDPGGWTRLREDLQTAAAKEGFSLVSKGSKGNSTADKLRQVLICARGRVVPASRRDRPAYAASANNMRPLVPEEICRFRLTIHQDHNVDRYLIKGGQGSSFHRCHGKLEGHVPKKIHRSIIDRAAASTNVMWHTTSLSRTDRWKDHKGAVLWFTGLSASGKSTIANEVECLLHKRSVHTYLLDGDNLRHGLCQDLDFSPDQRWENLRRAAEVAKLMADAGLVVLCAFVSPYQAHRERVKSIIAGGGIPFCEIYVKAHVEICEKRDPKGLYLKARAGVLKNFTGVSDPYEEPTHPDVLLDSTVNSVRILADQVVDFLDLTGKIVLSA